MTGNDARKVKVMNCAHCDINTGEERLKRKGTGWGTTERPKGRKQPVCLETVITPSLVSSTTLRNGRAEQRVAEKELSQRSEKIVKGVGNPSISEYKKTNRPPKNKKKEKKTKRKKKKKKKKTKKQNHPKGGGWGGWGGGGGEGGGGGVGGGGGGGEWRGGGGGGGGGVGGVVGVPKIRKKKQKRKKNETQK